MSRNDVFYYYSGSGGMIVKHMIMLSPEYIYWNDETEDQCQNENSIDKQADIKLLYTTEKVFGMNKSDSFTRWRQFELYDVDSKYAYKNNRNKHFLYSGWAGLYNDWSKNLEQTVWFEDNKPNCKIFLDCHDIFYSFVIRAAYEKNVGFFSRTTRQRTSLHETEQWKLNGEYERHIGRDDIETFIKMYLKWYNGWSDDKHNDDVHIVNMKNLMFSTHDSFLNEYLSLCENLKITPMINHAKYLKDHWLDKQCKRKPLFK